MELYNSTTIHRYFGTVAPLNNGRAKRKPQHYSLLITCGLVPRSLAGKPSAGICATPSRRIPLLYGPVVHVRRCNTHRFIDNRR